MANIANCFNYGNFYFHRDLNLFGRQYIFCRKNTNLQTQGRIQTQGIPVTDKLRSCFENIAIVLKTLQTSRLSITMFLKHKRSLSVTGLP